MEQTKQKSSFIKTVKFVLGSLWSFGRIHGSNKNVTISFKKQLTVYVYGCRRGRVVRKILIVSNKFLIYISFVCSTRKMIMKVCCLFFMLAGRSETDGISKGTYFTAHCVTVTKGGGMCGVERDGRKKLLCTRTEREQQQQQQHQRRAPWKWDVHKSIP